MDLQRVAALALFLLCFVAVGSVPASARAAELADPPPVMPEIFPATPAGFEIGAREAALRAKADPKVAEQTDRYGRLRIAIQPKDDEIAWQVGFKRDEHEVAQVIVDGVSGALKESWTGYQVAWPMARGYEGQFGHKLNAPWVWLPLAATFFLCLLDWRRPWRIVHLDLLVLLSFGVSQIFFNQGEIGVSTPLTYPPLLYLLGRAVWLGFRGGEPLRPTLAGRWLAVAMVFLLVFRVTLNVADSGVIDVGYAGTIGADKITHGEPIYGEGEFPGDNRFGDTYGPANYLAYVPFELLLPWSGEWDELAASHAAAIAFDLATVIGLIVFGIRLRPGARGRALGAALGFAWVAYPYTTFALQSNSNDSLVAALVVWALALFARPLARGALLALATAAKFAPLALAPLFATGERGLLGARRSARSLLGFTLAFGGVLALMLAHPAIDPGLATFWDRTVASQLERSSPFSVWGLLDGVDLVQKLALGLAAGFALLIAFVPRRRSIAQIGALSAAVIIALQLSVDHWFYLYIPWFAGPLLIALATAGRLTPGAAAELSPEPARGSG